MPVDRKAPVELPPDKVAIKRAIRMFDRKQTSSKEFVEQYMVPTKFVDPTTGGRASTKYIEFPFQAKLREDRDRQWAEGHGAKQIAGKPRQDGLTKAALLDMWECFCRGGGGIGNVFSYNNEATEEAFQFTWSLRRQTPPWVFVYIIPYVFGLTSKVDDGGGAWKMSNKRQIQLLLPKGESCLIQCKTASAKYSGSGSSPRWLLFDEFAKWKPDIMADPSSMALGWSDAPGNWWKIQSTGMGNNRFAERFRQAEAAMGAQGAFVAHFNGWLQAASRRRAFRSAEEREAFIATIAKLQDYRPEYEQRLLDAGATPEEIYWYRVTMMTDLGGDVDLFIRENPLTSSDMFLGTTTSVFDVDLLQSHEASARARDVKAERGDFVLTGDHVTFESRRGGRWMLYKRPEKGESFVFGGDCASGARKQRGSSKETDFTVLTILDFWTKRIVATYRAHSEGEETALQLLYAAVFFTGPYGPMRGYIEDDRYGAEVMRALRRYNGKIHGPVCGVYGEDILMLTTYDETKVLGNTDPIYGASASGKSIEESINAVRAYFKEIGRLKTGEETPLTGILVQEALCFERNKHGKPEAASGHDDTISSLGLTLRAHDEETQLGDILSSRVAPTRRESPARSALREMDKRLQLAAAGGDDGGAVPGF